jgi:pentatricopeptide repeat protein
MEAAGIEANVHTFAAMIDGCARAGQLPKAFGVYGIMISKNVKPDRVIFNTLINACGRAGAVERAFDVLSDMKAEATPVKPDHVTYGALIAACARGGQVRSHFTRKGAALQRVPRAQEEVCPSVSSEWVGE